MWVLISICLNFTKSQCDSFSTSITPLFKSTWITVSFTKDTFDLLLFYQQLQRLGRFQQPRMEYVSLNYYRKLVCYSNFIVFFCRLRVIVLVRRRGKDFNLVAYDIVNNLKLIIELYMNIHVF